MMDTISKPDRVQPSRRDGKERLKSRHQLRSRQENIKVQSGLSDRRTDGQMDGWRDSAGYCLYNQQKITAKITLLGSVCSQCPCADTGLALLPLNPALANSSHLTRFHS